MKVTVVGWPRSGTSWLLRLLVHYADGPSGEPWAWGLQGRHENFNKLHSVSEEERQVALSGGGHIVYIVRDPRDTAISGYFFHHQRDGFSIMAMTFLEYLQQVFAGHQRGPGFPRGWQEHTEKWLAMPDKITVRHEVLYDDRAGELLRILYEMGIEPEQTRVDYAVKQSYTYDALRPLYVRRDDWKKGAKVLPSGKPGEWKKHFGRAEIEFMREYCGDLMARLGYE